MLRPRVGIVGAGQLGRMLALAGYPLGIDCTVLDRSADAPGAQVAPFVQGALDDPEALAKLAAAVDVVTLEIENVEVAPLEALRRRIDVFPPPHAVAAAQDRLAEKTLFRSLGIPTAEFVAIDSAADAPSAARLGWPVVLKTRRMGYDGRGQRVVDSVEALAKAWRELGGVPSIAEAWVRFEREVSLIAAQGAAGQRAFYPLSENVHRDGILATTVAPYLDPALQQQAETHLAAVMSKLDYRGVLTVEFFHTAQGLVANEMAPRVHNSGHWTIEGAETSQFENHLRAVLGWPLGDTRARGHAAMLNLIGELPPREAVLATAGAHLHAYGKDPRPGRKVGHCTLVDSDRTRLLERLDALRNIVFPKKVTRTS
ncbi:MAG TPA: 5-(carboxyamino)imidazole ribonucleotide synthase [Gammaproteobacteria bacterium]|nr:5-(carboxyamino)imidazole ribonucleotide synthase [Gammaproteobacteria bacterium]